MLRIQLVCRSWKGILGEAAGIRSVERSKIGRMQNLRMYTAIYHARVPRDHLLCIHLP